MCVCVYVCIPFLAHKLSISHHSHTGLNAASLTTAQSYIEAFQHLAKQNNTLILPANAGDVTGVVGSAVTMYNALAKTMQANSIHQEEGPAEPTPPASPPLPFSQSSPENQ